MQRIEQLQQLTTVTCDGDLISKFDRDELVKQDFVSRSCGYNVITDSGIRILNSLGLLKINKKQKPVPEIEWS